MSITPDQARWFAETFDKMADNIEKAVLGKRHVVKLALTCMLSEGHLLLEDFPGTGQDAAGPRAGQHGPGHARPHPVHPRPAALRRHRRHRLRPAQGHLRVPPGPDLPHHRAGRRDQPGLAQDPVGAAGGDGGGPGHRRRRAAPGGASVHGDRHPEPDRAGRHLPAARGAARPVPDEDLGRLPRPRLDRRDADALRRSATARRWWSRSSPPTPSLRWASSPTRLRRPGRARLRLASSPRSPAGMPHVKLGLSARGCLALRAYREDVGGSPRVATTSSPTTSRRSPSRCCATGCCSTPRRSSAGSPSTRSSASSSTTSRPRPTAWPELARTTHRLAARRRDLTGWLKSARIHGCDAGCRRLGHGAGGVGPVTDAVRIGWGTITPVGRAVLLLRRLLGCWPGGCWLGGAGRGRRRRVVLLLAAACS